MLIRPIFKDYHEDFRQRSRNFIKREVAPRIAQWESQGHPERAFWTLAGKEGLLGYVIPTEYGGLGGDCRHGAILREELARVGVGGTGLGVLLHADVIAPFIIRLGSNYQKQQWLPRMANGEAIGALGMTERGAGSDARAIATSARRDGNEWVINGSKIFITNGYQSDLIVLVVKTDVDVRASRGMSLMLVESNRTGVVKVGPMPKIGLKYEDTAELLFENVRVPYSALLGEEGRGFEYLMHGMAWERLQIAIMGVSVCEAVLDLTVRHVARRHVFGKPLLDMQHTRFKLAECVTETRIGRQFVDRCLEQQCDGALDPVDAAMAKWWCTELQGRVVDACLQLHGGWGVIADQAIARAYVDARVTRIYGGANEILKEIVARSLARTDEGE
jgi:acyl-CoA dehydrogenase